MKRLLVLTCLVMSLVVPTSNASAASGPTLGLAFGQFMPDTPCTEPPEFLTQPTISGTPAIGSVLTTSSGSVYCAQYFRATFFRTDSAGNVIATVRTGPTQTCPDNSECTKTDAYTVVAGDAGYYIRASWLVWHPAHPSVTAWTGLIGPVPSPPTQSPSELYGDNGDPRTGEWSGGTGGTNAWTVHQYANRYVIWTYGRGVYVIGRGVAGAQIPGHENHYMGPGYIGQFSPREGPPSRLLVNDALQPGELGPRDGVHGGLGCFSVDFYRVNVGLVDLNCRRRSNGSTPGVYQVANDVVTPDPTGVTVTMTTRYRDSAGPVFTVTYSHRFTAANVRTTYTWQSDTNDIAYIKEPRIVAVFGTSDLPVYYGVGQTRDYPPNCNPPRHDGTYGYGQGVWALDPGLNGMEAWDMDDVVPWCSTVKVGPGAPIPHNYHRGGFSFNVVGVWRDLFYDDAGYHDYDGVTSNFNSWRRNSDGAASPPQGTQLTPCPGGDVPSEACPVWIGKKQPICDTCAANAWELGRVPGQYGVFVAMEAWRASISIWNYLERARRLPAHGVNYAQSFKF